MALTDSERDRIVALRLDGMTIREVVAATGHATGTVSKVWHLYLAETAQDRRPDLGLRREELLQRFERNAGDARVGVAEAMDTGDHAAVARYLAAELAALRRVVELEGLAEPGGWGMVPVATAEEPLPWRTPAEALGYRVARREADRAESAAMNSLIAPFPSLGTPTVAELLPAVVEAVEATVED